MKQFNKIFLALLMVVITSMLFGCKPNNQQTITLSINDAKTTIINALKIDTPQKNTLALIKNANNNNNTNRNIFAKLNNSAVDLRGNFDDGNSITGSVQRTGVVWSKYSLNCGTNAEYYDGTYAYLNDNETKNNFESSRYGIILQTLDCIYIDLLFLDESFDTIYNSEVTKTTTENGYYYIMDVNMSQYVTFVSQKVEAMGIGSEGVFGEGAELQRNKEEGSVALKIIFDNSNNIIKLEMTVTCCTGSAELYDTVINVSKQETEVVAPSWFNIANYN